MSAPRHPTGLKKWSRLTRTGLALLGCITANIAVAQPRAAVGVSVAGNGLLRDGRPWTPHGIVQIAFVAPPAAQTGVFAEAYRHYAPGDYAAMRRFGMDSVRIQISQPGLDPADPLFAPDFRDRLIAAVRTARAAGLVVMLSVQDEVQSGEKHGVAPLPNDATRRVWHWLAPVFARDPGVMYELLNEPNLEPTPANWHQWADAMNATIAVVRSAGARNVVVADGLRFAERLSGAPDLNDPAQQVAYASHPYAHSAEDQTPAQWEAKFGAFARRHAVIVTEWATVPQYYCDLHTPAYAEAFLRYLDGRHIGLMAYGWDFAGPKFGSTFHGFPPQQTSYQGLRCGDDGFGPGRAVGRFYSGTLKGP